MWPRGRKSLSEVEKLHSLSCNCRISGASKEGTRSRSCASNGAFDHCPGSHGRDRHVGEYGLQAVETTMAALPNSVQSLGADHLLELVE